MIHIPIQSLHHHPDNPRQGFGDLTELTASIEKNGVLQNLTVVPMAGNMGRPETDPQYFVVIGNRRLEAAKKAKLAVLPCTVQKDMSHADQIAAMLMENMQRNDLTIYEQAQGFQLMLDLGESEKAISEKTGFSKATIKRRVKLLEYDQDELMKAVKRGARLEDFAGIDKLESPERRVKALEAVGTANFNSVMMAAKDAEKVDKAMVKVRERLSLFAKEVENRYDYPKPLNWIKHFDVLNCKDDELSAPDDAADSEYVFTPGRHVSLYKVGDDEPVDHTEKNRRRELIRAAESEIAERAYKLRRQFIAEFPGGKNLAAPVNSFIFYVISSRGYMSPMDPKVFSELLGIGSPKGKKINADKVDDEITKNPERVLAVAAYAKLADSESKRCSDWNGEHCTNNDLVALYDQLTKLGHEISDEEREWMSGEHECFKSGEHAESEQVASDDQSDEEQ